MAAEPISITIDDADVQAKLELLRLNLSEEKFEKELKWIVDKTGRRVKPILKVRVPEQYVASAKWVNSDTKKRFLRSGANGVECVIPLKGKLGTIGGNSFPAYGGVWGWEALKYKGKPYKIIAQIVKGKASVLPKAMQNQGGFAPWINTSDKAKAKLHGVVFVRKSKEQTPIAPVKGLGIPEMPPNRSREQVENDILEEMVRQVDYYLQRL